MLELSSLEKGSKADEQFESLRRSMDPHIPSSLLFSISPKGMEFAYRREC